VCVSVRLYDCACMREADPERERERGRGRGRVRERDEERVRRKDSVHMCTLERLGKKKDRKGERESS